VPDSAEPAAPKAWSGRSNLALRVVSSLVLAPLAIIVVWLGGWPFVAFWTLAACIVLWEWTTLVKGGPGVGAPGSFVGWMVLGLAYALALLIAPVLLRADAKLGFTAIIFLFAVVWAGDIAAYFVGRAVGGPKLWAAVSPKKTWSGAIGGAMAAMAAGLVVAAFAGLTSLGVVALLALFLSSVAQLGDLFESAIKRRFGAKDSSGLLPGHGGLMDRLDGFLTAALAAAMVGLFRGGLSAPAQGLLVWWPG
jgi:phosphatidate cytidylyltransferase